MCILTRSSQSTVVPEYTQRYIIIFDITHMIRESLPGPVPLGSTPTLGLHYHPCFPLATVDAMTTSTRLLEHPVRRSCTTLSTVSVPQLDNSWSDRACKISHAAALAQP